MKARLWRLTKITLYELCWRQLLSEVCHQLTWSGQFNLPLQTCQFGNSSVCKSLPLLTIVATWQLSPWNSGDIDDDNSVDTMSMFLNNLLNSNYTFFQILLPNNLFYWWLNYLIFIVNKVSYAGWDRPPELDVYRPLGVPYKSKTNFTPPIPCTLETIIFHSVKRSEKNREKGWLCFGRCVYVNIGYTSFKRASSKSLHFS